MIGSQSSEWRAQLGNTFEEDMDGRMERISTHQSLRNFFLHVARLCLVLGIAVFSISE